MHSFSIEIRVGKTDICSHLVLKFEEKMEYNETSTIKILIYKNEFMQSFSIEI